jgi:hypothetical protein
MGASQVLAAPGVPERGDEERGREEEKEDVEHGVLS